MQALTTARSALAEQGRLVEALRGAEAKAAKASEVAAEEKRQAAEARSERQIPYSKVSAGEHTVQLDVGVKGKNFWVTPNDRDHARAWFGAGFTTALRTPDDTVVFVAPEERLIH